MLCTILLLLIRKVARFTKKKKHHHWGVASPHSTFLQTNHTKGWACTIINKQDIQHIRCDVEGSDIIQFINCALHEADCIYRIKGAHNTHVSGWLSRKIKISYAILQSNLDSSEHCAFFSSRDKERTVASAQTHKITNTGADTHSCTLPWTHSLHTFSITRLGKTLGKDWVFGAQFLFHQSITHLWGKADTNLKIYEEQPASCS